MKRFRSIMILASAIAIGFGAIAQVETTGGVRRRAERDKKQNTGGPEITERMQSFYDTKAPHDADLAWMRQIYRQIDLSKDVNAPLYFPEDVIDGKENLFRTILRLVVDGKVPAYEYLDGREVFTDKYKIDVPEMLDRFGIYYTKGSGTGKNQKYVIEEADVPTAQVMNYYIIEKWEFDKRTNQMKTRVEAICPVLNRYGDFGGEAKYPMFWVKFDQLRPYLAQQYVFITDDNNLPLYSLDDYFNMGMYEGDIYKTQNLRNLSMMQLHPDADDLKHAQDSIDRRLRSFGDNLWVPTREEYLAAKAKEKEAALNDSTGETEKVSERQQPREEKSSTVRNKRSTKKSTAKAPKTSTVKTSSSSSSSSAAKSVRRRKR